MALTNADCCFKYTFAARQQPENVGHVLVLISFYQSINKYNTVGLATLVAHSSNELIRLIEGYYKVCPVAA